MNETQQTMLSIQEAQDLYFAEGGGETGVKIDIFKNKRWLKNRRNFILASWEENNGQVENFTVVLKGVKVKTPLVSNDTNDYPMIGAMAAIGGPGMGLGYALGDAIFNDSKKSRGC